MRIYFANNELVISFGDKQQSDYRKALRRNIEQEKANLIEHDIDYTAAAAIRENIEHRMIDEEEKKKKLEHNMNNLNILADNMDMTKRKIVAFQKLLEVKPL